MRSFWNFVEDDFGLIMISFWRFVEDGYDDCIILNFLIILKYCGKQLWYDNIILKIYSRWLWYNWRLKSFYNYNDINYFTWYLAHLQASSNVAPVYQHQRLHHTTSLPDATNGEQIDHINIFMVIQWKFRPLAIRQV